MATIVVAHGAWSAAWVWRKMRARLAALGHELVTPTYTGLGERAHLATPAVDLATHVADVTGVIEAEDLRDIVLVGHSYGGMVATALASRLPDRIAALVYLDAFVPRDGQALLDLQPEAQRLRILELVRKDGEGWKVPPNPPPADTPADDLAWMTPRRRPQPLLSFTQPVRLAGGEPAMPRHYVYCTRAAPGDVFRQFAMRARAEPGWTCHELDASHNPHVTTPDDLARLLDAIARR